jgi:hypothetical protein
VSKGSVASGGSERVGVSACGRIGVMSGSRLGCERLSGLVLIMGLQRMGPPSPAGAGVQRDVPQWDGCGLWGWLTTASQARHAPGHPLLPFHHGIAGQNTDGLGDADLGALVHVFSFADIG